MRFSRKPARDEEVNTCLTYAVARYFNMNPKRVPFFVGYRHYVKYLRAFFRRRGFRIEPWHYHPRHLKNKRKFYIVQGQSPNSKAKNPHRGKQHVVLYRGRKRFYDPNPQERYLQGRPLYVWMVTKM